MSAADILRALWSGSLALTIALLLIMALRMPWRRLFGSEHACRLWWLVPLAIAASQLPQAPIQGWKVSLPASVAKVAGAPGAVASNPISISALPAWVSLCWLIGVAMMVLVGVLQQRRFMLNLRGARRLPAAASDGALEVLLAATTDPGPALVGLWRPRILLPNDFPQRYSNEEQALILAHETAHAHRRDGLAKGVAVVLRAMFWFHPLAWWALRRFERDQELACDALVMRDHPRQRRAYATAMLKTQITSHPLPLGCSWVHSHLIRERIAMLRLSAPSFHRSSVAHVLLAATGLCLSGLAYAASQSPPAATSAPVVYQVAMIIRQSGAVLSSPTLCMRAGQQGTIRIGEKGEAALELALIVSRVKHDLVQVRTDGSVRDKNDKQVPVHAVLRGPAGQSMSVRVTGGDGAAPLRIDMIPQLGCAASRAAAAGQASTR